MILDYLRDLNWLAVIVAAVAWFAFSAIWYSVPPLSSAWMRAAKVTPGDGTALVVQIYEQKGGSYWLIYGLNAIIAYSIVAIIVTVWT